ncbi:MAG: CotH kinase family protein [Candidatus Kapaibacterium sp.]
MKHIIILLLLTSYIGYGQLQINEVCSDNDELLQAADGEYYDWIEIYNKSDMPIQLSDYYLTDDEKKLNKWRFTSHILPSNQFILVYASGLNGLILGEQHANFKLSSKGETLFLTDGVNIVDMLEFGRINEDYTYGRLEESSALLTNLATPTPGESNRSSGTIIADKHSGIYNSEFNLTLKAAAGQKIYYTTNGDDPTTESQMYTGPIYIKDEYEVYDYLNTPTTPSDEAKCYHSWKKVEVEIPRCNVISFRVLDDNDELGNVFSKSFFFQKPQQFSVLSIVTDNQNLFNYDTGIYVPGVKSETYNLCYSGNYNMRGSEWERPLTFAYIKDDELVTEQNAGMRIHGSWSRGAPQKSLRLYARKSYGINKFPNDFLPELELKSLDNFIVRATMSDFSRALIKDAVSMESVRGLNFEQIYIEPVIVYINGNYWGIHEIRNRFDEDYFAEKYGLDEDSIDIVIPVVFGNPSELKYQKMKAVYDFIVENDLSKVENYNYIQQVFDIPQIIDYFIAETYFANTDWPVNNMQFWNSNIDKKYKPLYYDLDAGWRDSRKDMIEYASQMEHDNYPNPRNTNVIFSKLLSNIVFKQQFIDRALYLIENEFSYEKLKPIIDKYVNKYSTEMINNIDRWHYPVSESEWQKKLFEDYYEFALLRGCYYKMHLVYHFDLDSSILCVATPVASTNQEVLSISPNPASDYITIDNISSDVIYIVDVHGKEIMLIDANYKNKLTIDISKLAPSIYFVKSSNRVYKFIKIR